MSYMLQDMPGKLKSSQLENNGLDLLFGPVYGKTRFVQNGHGQESDGGNQTGLRMDNPFETLKAAIAASAKWDRIIVGPGHTESVTAADHWDWQDVGCEVIGMGIGGQRPTFTFDTVVGASFLLDKASTRLRNLKFVGGLDALTGPINPQAADCQIIDCEFEDSTGQCNDCIVTTAAADRFLLDRWRHRGATAADAQSAIQIVGGTDIVLRDLHIDGNFASSVIEQLTTAFTNIVIERGYFRNRNAVDKILKLATDTCTGWMIGPTLIRIADNTTNITECLPDPAGTESDMQFGDNIWVVNLDGERGMLWNGTASTDA